VSEGEGPKNKGVGKGRPPEWSRWKPGQSGNPRGRPKRIRNSLSLFSDALSQRVSMIVNGRRRTVTTREAIILALVGRAMKGDPKAVAAVFAKEPEIEESEKRVPFPLNGTLKEAMEAYQQLLRGGMPLWVEKHPRGLR
jgi:hypothetical protein